MATKKIMNSFLYAALIIFLCLCAQAANVSAQNDTKSEKGAAKDKAHKEMMNKWMEYSTPGEGHKALEPLVGNWDYTISLWQTPDSKPQKATGTSEVKWIMGGRYLEQTAKGTSMGQEFRGMGIMGYDNMKKEYNGVWIDNMGTGMTTSSGSYDPFTKSFTEKGSLASPEEGWEVPFRGVTTIISPEKYTYEMYITGKDGKESRVMEIVYTRKK
jgi:hypothetical protein